MPKAEGIPLKEFVDNLQAITRQLQPMAGALDGDDMAVSRVEVYQTIGDLLAFKVFIQNEKGQETKLGPFSLGKFI